MKGFEFEEFTKSVLPVLIVGKSRTLIESRTKSYQISQKSHLKNWNCELTRSFLCPFYIGSSICIWQWGVSGTLKFDQFPARYREIATSWISPTVELSAESATRFSYATMWIAPKFAVLIAHRKSYTVSGKFCHRRPIHYVINNLPSFVESEDVTVLFSSMWSPALYSWKLTRNNFKTKSDFRVLQLPPAYHMIRYPWNKTYFLSQKSPKKRHFQLGVLAD